MRSEGFTPSGLSSPGRNLCLAILQEPALDQFLSCSYRLELQQQEVLTSPATNPGWLYFLEEGLASIIKVDSTGSRVESGMIGREGVIGGQALYGLPETHGEIKMMVAGVAHRIQAEVFKQIIGKGVLDRPLALSFFALFEQTSQNVLCNRHHELESRLARWLLQVSDFTQSRVLLFNHLHLAEMLGVTRSAVTIAAGNLLSEGMIDYSRGQIAILQRKGLREAACDCYAVIRKLYKTIYPHLF